MHNRQQTQESNWVTHIIPWCNERLPQFLSGKGSVVGEQGPLVAVAEHDEGETVVGRVVHGGHAVQQAEEVAVSQVALDIDLGLEDKV